MLYYIVYFIFCTTILFVLIKVSCISDTELVTWCQKWDWEIGHSQALDNATGHKQALGYGGQRSCGAYQARG